MRWTNPLGIISLILCCPLLCTGQHADHGPTAKYTLAGYIRDSTAREALPGAAITVLHNTAGASSNAHGFYSLTLPAGTYTVQYTFIGHKPVRIAINLTANQRRDVELPEESIGLDEIVISGAETPAQELAIGTHDITPQTLRKLPSFAGANDVIKSLQWLPGVSTIGEGSTGFFVRGGGIDQNLILLDDAPVYNAAHLLGFLSVFNEDAIKNARLHKGYFPIEYGGRLSSVLDIRMKEGNAKTFKASGGIGILSGARLLAEGPVNQGRGSFMLSARRTFAEPILWLTRIDSASNVQFKGTKLYFYDINAKLNYKLNSKNDLFLSTYTGTDVNKLPILDYNINWGNITSTMRWNHIFNNQLFSNVSFIYSTYDYNLSTPSAGNLFEWKSQINDVNVKANLTYYQSDAITWKFGINGIVHTFKPGYNRSGNETLSVPNRKALESAVYAGIEAKLTDRITTETGLRLSSFTNLGPTTHYRFDNGKPQDSIIHSKGSAFHTAIAFEPRFIVNFKVNEQQAIKASYMQSAQYLQLLSNSSLAAPQDYANRPLRNIQPPRCLGQLGLHYRHAEQHTRRKLSIRRQDHTGIRRPKQSPLTRLPQTGPRRHRKRQREARKENQPLRCILHLQRLRPQEPVGHLCGRRPVAEQRPKRSQNRSQHGLPVLDRPNHIL